MTWLKVRTASTRAAGCLLVALFALSGCRAKRPTQTEVWMPDPAVSWTHLTAGDAPPARNGYTIVAKQPTVGLFPANLGVTRVALGAENDETEPRLTADPRNEFLRWNHNFDDLMAISDVFPILQRDLGGGEATPAQILAAFHALDAKLALIYAVNQPAQDESEMFGILYDARNAEPIASLHAHAVSLKPPEDEEEAKDAEDPYLLWSTDSRALVRDRFADTLHACVRELILHDQPPALEDKSGWTPAGPIRPAEWPPRTSRYRRGR